MDYAGDEVVFVSLFAALDEFVHEVSGGLMGEWSGTDFIKGIIPERGIDMPSAVVWAGSDAFNAVAPVFPAETIHLADLAHLLGELNAQDVSFKTPALTAEDVRFAQAKDITPPRPDQEWLGIVSVKATADLEVLRGSRISQIARVAEIVAAGVPGDVYTPALFDALYMHVVQCVLPKWSTCSQRAAGGILWELSAMWPGGGGTGGGDIPGDDLGNDDGLFYERIELFYSVELHYDFGDDDESTMAFIF